ncbi:MAG: SIR2 family protein [Archangium sp.]|nr:SIR2 family protein [Archangium sp.]
MAIELDSSFTGFLSSKLEAAQVMLFTGAGFSMDCKDIDGNRLPSADKLTKELWELVYGGDAFDSETSLTDIYGLANSKKKNKLTEFLRRRLTVDSSTIPEFYQNILSAPWKKIYTVNIDDLCNAAERRFDLPVTFRPISGTRPFTPNRSNTSKPIIDVIHLNGLIDDIPDSVTFSLQQYSERLASQEPTYHQLVADLSSHPFIFIGTKLDEPVLWQHIALRGHRGGRQFKELRPRSFLVTPSIGRAKQGLLDEYNCEWRKGYTEDLAALLGAAPFSSAGTIGRTAHQSRPRHHAGSIANVGDLLANAKARDAGLYLSGDEPVWSDLRDGHTIHRASDTALLATAEALLRNTDTQELLLVTGTAGSGKTTAAMRLAASLSATANNCFWFGADQECSPYELRRMGTALPQDAILFVDDADRFGSEITSVARELVSDGKLALLVLIMRAHKIDRALHLARLDAKVIESAVPQLADSDINSLIQLLDQHNLLGRLKGKPLGVQFHAFSEKAGRQLLVAMIEATSGKRFEEKIVDEWESLSSDEERNIYALLAICHSLKFAPSKDEVLFAAGEMANSSSRNEVLNALDRLTNRHVISWNSTANTFRTRHRFLADILLTELSARAAIGAIIGDLAFVFATKVTASTPRNEPCNRFLRRLLNHDFLARAGSVEQARSVYQRVETLCSWSFHYLLQRGSLEVESGNLRLADNYLSQARALEPNDSFVATEYAYMRIKRAYEEPSSPTAEAQAAEAIQILREQIRLRGLTDEHPYHVLGSQGLAWSRRGIKNAQERLKLVGELEMLLKQAVSIHTSNEGLKTLLRDLQAERLKLGVAV